MSKDQASEKINSLEIDLSRRPRPKVNYNKMSEEELTTLFQNRLATNAVWAKKALLTLYDQQTQAERDDPLNVHESNGKGFSPQDQEFLSSLAEQERQGNLLSEKQMVWVHKLMPKYAGQLARLVLTGEASKLRRTLTVKNINVTWAGNTGTTYSEKIGIPDQNDPEAYPHIAAVVSPSGLSNVEFHLDKDGVRWDNEHDVIEMVTYSGKLGKRKLVLQIVAGEEPGPDWSIYPEGTEAIVKQGIGF